MAATIKIKNSSTAGAAPTSSDLVQGELAVNVTDKRLYTENSGGTIVELGTNPSVPVTFPDGSASAPSLTNSGDTNTGMFFPAADTIAFAEGGTESMRLDSSGNLGLGVTPSAWSAQKAVELPNGVALASYTAGVNIGQMFTNAYYNGTNYIYKNSDYAEQYAQRQGAHIWYNSASGTAGNAITFTQAMTLDASGNLGIGTTSPSQRLTIGQTNGYPVIDFKNSGTGYGDIGFQVDKMVLSAYSTTPLTFWTNSNERARIDSSGNLLVAVTSTTVPGYGNTTTGTVINSNNPACFSLAKADFVQVINQNTIDGSNYDLVTFRTGGSQRGNILSNGTTVSYNTSSDYRLKENVQPMTGALATVAQLKPCTYTWKETGQNSQGFIAHELAEVVPDAVSGEKDAVNEDGSIKPQGIDTSFLVATLTAAIQELKAEFDAYKATHP